MEKTRIFDEEFKQKVSDGCEKIKDTLSDALLTEEGKLDTERIGNAARETALKVESTVREGYEKFNSEYVKDGSLDKEKLGSALNDAYQKTGRFLATSMSRLAGKLADKFGVDEENSVIIDSELVIEEPSQDA